MNIGSLYLVKEWSWLLFPTKEMAVVVAQFSRSSLCLGAAAAAANWSRRYKCEVVCFSPDSIVVFLEEDRKLKKVLTSDGKIGWTLFDKNYNDCFEEMKAKS